MSKELPVRNTLLYAGIAEDHSWNSEQNGYHISKPDQFVQFIFQCCILSSEVNDGRNDVKNCQQLSEQRISRSPSIFPA